jgi:hypothetical protein
VRRRVTCALAWGAVLASWAPMLRLLARLGDVWPLPRRATGVGRRELRFGLGFGLVGMTAALALVAANDC